MSSTLRGAVELGYACVLLQDCAAAYDPADHEASVRLVHSKNHDFGRVSDSTRLGRALAGSTVESLSPPTIQK